MNTITASEFAKIIKSQSTIDLIDVRTPAEFASLHVENAVNCPLGSLNAKSIQSGRKAVNSEPIYVICRSGARGEKACELLCADGIKNVVNIQGGTLACAAIGIPVVRGRKTLALNCQVQLIAGTSILIGSILAYFASPLWGAIPLAMGLGLVHSGLTDTCGMGAMLSKMPWNQA